MAEIPKRLGTTTATSATTVFESSSVVSSYTVVSSIVIANTSTTAYTYNVSTSTTTNLHGAYIVAGATIAGNDSVILVAGVCLDPTNRFLVAHASNAAVHITAYGVTGP